MTAALLIATLVLAAWTIYPVLRLQYQQQREVQTLQSELTGLKARNSELRTQVSELKTPQGVEKMARENLGLVKPGEKAYVVTGPGSEPTSTTDIVTEKQSKPPLYRQALDALFGFH